MRLVTRSDFDGICCAVLLKELGIISGMHYTHPKDVQDGKENITSNDVLANVPYAPGCGMWFDHHSSEEERIGLEGKYQGKSVKAPSCARVIYDYYASDPAKKSKLDRFESMLKGVDKVDAAQLDQEDIESPKGWVMLGFICDPRTGLGYHKSYRISNKQLMTELVDHIRDINDPDKILALQDLQERVKLYNNLNTERVKFLRNHSRVDGPILIIDTRGAMEMPPGNRFLQYAIFPETNISIQMIDGRGKEFVAFSVGYSTLNRTATVDVGSLMLKHGGGGHKAVGTCQVPYADANRVLNEIIEAIKKDS